MFDTSVSYCNWELVNGEFICEYADPDFSWTVSVNYEYHFKVNLNSNTHNIFFLITKMHIYIYIDVSSISCSGINVYSNI